MISAGSIVGKKEFEGPLGNLFDMAGEDNLFGEQTWEAAESRMQKEACVLALEKAGIDAKEVRYLYGETCCGRELQLPWEWRHFRFLCLDFMGLALLQGKHLHLDLWQWRRGMENTCLR